MGKARIISDLGDGSYSVEILLDRSREASERARISREQDRVEAQQAEAQAEFEEANQAYRDALAALQAAINEFNAAEEQDISSLSAARADVHRSMLRVNLVKSRMAQLNLEMSSINKDLGRWNSIELNPVRQALCIDGEEGLSGQVGTIEPPDEVDANSGVIRIRPGFDGRAEYDAVRDGVIARRSTQSPEQAYLNAALLPGVQRWRPKHRIGVITSISGDTCSVTLEPALSSAQSLPVNQWPSLTDVGVSYRDCGITPFEEGDRVVVELGGWSWGNPVVIGFADEPKPCGLSFHLFGRSRRDDVNKSGQVAHEIAPGLGRLMSTTYLWSSEGIPPQMRDVALANGVFLRAIGFGTEFYRPHRFTIGSRTVRLDESQRIIKIASNGNEVFVLVFDDPRGVDRHNKILVYSMAGQFIRSIKIPPRWFLISAFFGGFEDDRRYHNQDYCVFDAVGENLFLFFGRARGTMTCITSGGRLVWRRHMHEFTIAVGGMAGPDFCFLTEYESPAIQMIRSDTGMPVRRIVPAGDLSMPKFMPKTVAYTYDALYVAGYVDGVADWQKGTRNRNRSIVAHYSFDERRVPVYKGWANVIDYLGEPQDRSAQNYWADLWMMVDSVKLHEYASARMHR